MFALAEGLCRAGHEVTLYYTSFFGQVFSPKPIDGLHCYSSGLFDPDFNYSVPSLPIFDLSIEAQMQYLINDIFTPFQPQISQAAHQLCQENDVVIGVAMLYQLICMAEKYKVPFISYQVDSVYVPSEGNAKIWLDDWIEKNWEPIVNPYRASLGLSPVTDLRRHFYPSKLLNLLAYSPMLEPKKTYWGDTFEVCGYLHGTQVTTIDDLELKAFIDAGSPPIFISMGSMAFYEPDITLLRSMLLKAVELAGCRAIIQLGHAAQPQGKLNDNVYVAGYVAHEAVLPHCSGVVHHGGSGTVHTALKYACPSITIGYAFDQFFWGEKLVGLGVSPALLERRLFDEIQLAGDLRKLMCYQKYKDAAQYMRLKMKREDGVKKAVRCIEAVCERIKDKVS